MTSSKFFTSVIMTFLVVVAMVSCDISEPKQVSDPPTIGSIVEESENVNGPPIRGPILNTNTAVTRFEIGPATESVVFNTGSSQPIEGLRFIFGGSPKILTQSINGIQDGQSVNGKKDGLSISFVDDDNPNGIPPSSVTRHFAVTDVLTNTHSVNFKIDIMVSDAITVPLTIIAKWNERWIN